MPVEFVLGRAGSGKTTYCYLQIEEELKKEGYNSLMMLVPEQFNLQTQLDLSKRLYPGLLRAEVASFNTLSREVFKEVGKVEYPIIEDLERIMILKKVIEEHKKELLFFKKNIHNTGFIEEINRLITLFEQTGIDKDTLAEFTQALGITKLFKSKFEDIQKIYDYFETYIQGNFVTVEKTLNLLAKNIYKSEVLKETIVWIDGFYGFTGSQLSILEALMKKCKKVILTLPADRAYGIEDKIKETHPFYESVKTYQKLIDKCKNENIPYQMSYLHLNQYADKAAELTYLETHYLNHYKAFYHGESEQIKIYAYPSKNEEIEEVAKEILRLVRDEEYRYHDIGIIVGDLGAYKSHIESILREYDMPYFLDMKRSIHTNSLVAVIEAVLEVITTGYSYKSIMALLRTELLNIEREAIDLLENYLLAYGIKGKKKWHETWIFTLEELNLEKINRIRERILEPIDQLEKRLKETRAKGKLTVQDITSALYYFLEDIKAYTQLQERIIRYKKEENRLLEIENTQIWGQVIEVFERLVELLGAQEIAIGAYKKILSTSFSYLKMGIIPPVQDQMIIGTLDRTRLPRIKALFILGTNEGLIPKVEESMAIFSDMDKAALSEICKDKEGAKERFHDTLISTALHASHFSVYTILTRASHKLYMSAALADEKGKLLRPSMVYYKIRKMFRNVERPIHKDFLGEVTKPLPTFEYVGSKLRDYIEGRPVEEDWRDIVSWYHSVPLWRDRLEGLMTYLFYTNQQHYLDEKTTPLLYNEVLKTNISKLETFRNCACSYFMRYGIKAEERRILNWDSAKIGTLFHGALEQYPKELDLLNTTWTGATKQQIDHAVKSATAVVFQNFKMSQKEEGRLKYTTSKVEKMAKRAILALTEHLKNGEFVPKGYEINFSEGAELPPIQVDIDEQRKLLITGQIDRVDVYYKQGEESYIKVLDYKTGNKNFSLLEVYYGLQLQLLLYLDAYLKWHKDYKPGGVFYFHINNPYVAYKTGMTEEEIQVDNLKQFKLSGLVLEEPEVIHALDKQGKGTTIPVSMNKDGSIKKGSSVATREQFSLLETHIVETIRNLGKQILEGKVSAQPYKLGDKHPCTYCKYTTICQFDENEIDNDYEKLEPLTKDEVWEKLCVRKEEKGHGMD